MRKNVTITCTDLRDKSRLERYLWSVRKKGALGYTVESDDPLETAGVVTVMKAPEVRRAKKNAN